MRIIDRPFAGSHDLHALKQGKDDFLAVLVSGKDQIDQIAWFEHAGNGIDFIHHDRDRPLPLFQPGREGGWPFAQQLARQEHLTLFKVVVADSARDTEYILRRNCAGVGEFDGYLADGKVVHGDDAAFCDEGLGNQQVDGLEFPAQLDRFNFLTQITARCQCSDATYGKRDAQHRPCLA